MKRFLMAAAIASASFAGLAQAATFTGANLSGDITSLTYTGVTGDPVGGPLDYTFELEASGGSNWIVVSTAGTSTATANGTFTLTAAPGYFITDVFMSAGGKYNFTSNGTFNASSLLTIGSDTQSDSVSKTGVSGRSTSGNWTLTNAPDLAYSCCTSSLTGTWSFNMEVAGPGTSSANGLNTNGGNIYSAPTLNVTVAAIPEPGEWAMMLAGLSAVGLIARRRRAS